VDQPEIRARGLYHPAWIRLIATPGLRLVLPILAARPVRRLSGTALLHAATTIRSDSARQQLPRFLSHLSRSRLAHQLSIVSRLLKEGAYPLDLESVDCPVVFVWGDRDRAAIWRSNHDHLLKAAQRASHGHSEVITGCGHMPQLELPDELFRLIDAFSPLRTDDEASTFDS
jgi:pimeloyl-ACP methyl ester carboxylesterase